MRNLELMKKRLEFQGGISQEARMIKDKYKSFQKALLYSYQSANVQKINEKEIRKVLINPDKNSIDYDEKMISIDFAFGYQPGDIFEWIEKKTYWLIYLPELTEDAYFRAAIRRCKHQLFWVDMDKKPEERKISSYAYIKGPVDASISNVSFENGLKDKPNYSLEIYLPNNEETRKYFKRYQKFAFNNLVWEIQAVDDISTIGILKIFADEDYENKLLDDVSNEKITDAFYIAPIIDEDKNDKDIIVGDQIIKPIGHFNYVLDEDIPLGGEWFIVESKSPVTIEQTENEDEISVQWTEMQSGQFTLAYKINDQTYYRQIIVESLF